MRKLFIYVFVTAITIVVNISMLSPAMALYLFYHTNEDGSFYVHVYEDDGQYVDRYLYDKNGKYLGNPNPEGDGSDGTHDIELLIEALKKKQGSGEITQDFWRTPAGYMLVKTGKGPQPGDPIDPDPGGGLWMEADGLGGGGGGGFDPMGGPISEQIGKKKGKKSDDGDDGDGDDGKSGDSGLWGEEYPANPELVNPVPISRARFGSKAKDYMASQAPTDSGKAATTKGGKLKLGGGMQSMSGKGPEGFGGNTTKPLFKTATPRRKSQTLAKLSPQKLGPKLILKDAKRTKTLNLTAGKTSEAIFRVMNSGDSSSKVTAYSVKCKKLSNAGSQCPSFNKRETLAVIGAHGSHDIKVKLTFPAGEYELKLKLANGAKQTVILKVAAVKLEIKPGALKSTPKVKPRLQLH